MSERKLQVQAIISALIVLICASLYAWGGIEAKYLRRFVAPAICCIYCFIISRDWRYLIQMPFMFGSLSIGYGADLIGEKILRRSLFGLANGLSGSIRNLWHKFWLISVTNVLLVLSMFIVFGVFNPLVARVEELLLGMFIFLIPVLSAHKKEGD